MGGEGQAGGSSAVPADGSMCSASSSTSGGIGGVLRDRRRVVAGGLRGWVGRLRGLRRGLGLRRTPSAIGDDGRLGLGGPRSRAAAALRQPATRGGEICLLGLVLVTGQPVCIAADHQQARGA